jgi:hypothetical protein
MKFNNLYLTFAAVFLHLSEIAETNLNYVKIGIYFSNKISFWTWVSGKKKLFYTTILNDLNLLCATDET